MTTYLIAYDLVGRDEDYPPLWKALAALGAVRILKSDWLVRSGNTSVQLREHLKQYIDTNDRLFITRVDAWAYYNIMNPAEAAKLLPGA